MTTYYVAKTGSNTNNGSSGNPWLTISYAMSQNLQPGDTVVVRDGTYNESVTFSKSGSAAGGMLTLKSENKGGAKIKGTQADGSSGILAINKHHIRVEGFTVDSFTTGINGNKVYYYEVVNNTVSDCVSQAIYVRESEFILIEGNETFGNNQTNKANNSISVHFMQNASGDTTAPVGAYTDHLPVLAPAGYRLIVRGNHCHENGIGTTSTDGGGIMIDQNPTPTFTPDPYTYHRLLENNLCWGNAGPGIIVLEAKNTFASNNTTWHNGRKSGAGGFVGNLVNRGDNITWANNIAVSEKSYNANVPAISCPVLATRSPQVYTGVVWRNNITFNGVVGEASLYSNGGNSGNLPASGATGNLLGVNPLLVSPPTNFRCSDTSPCVNGGTAAFAVGLIDFAGDPRVVGVIDIGAYEASAITQTEQVDAGGYGNGGGGVANGKPASGKGAPGLIVIRYPYTP